MIFVDTNVLVDVVDNDPIWAGWSRRQLVNAATLGEVAINDIVYAELSVGYQTPEEVEAVITRMGVVLVPIPRLALFIAGKAYQRYRASGGIRTGVLPDFFIGAQALVAGAELITRDVGRYRTYFPGLALVAPRPN